MLYFEICKSNLLSILIKEKATIRGAFVLAPRSSNKPSSLSRLELDSWYLDQLKGVPLVYFYVPLDREYTYDQTLRK